MSRSCQIVFLLVTFLLMMSNSIACVEKGPGDDAAQETDDSVAELDDSVSPVDDSEIADDSTTSLDDSEIADDSEFDDDSGPADDDTLLTDDDTIDEPAPVVITNPYSFCENNVCWTLLDGGRPGMNGLSIAFDRSGNLQAAVTRSNNLNFLYSRSSAGDWTEDMISHASGGKNLHPTLLLDADGTMTVLYFTDYGDIFLAKGSIASWNFAPIQELSGQRAAGLSAAMDGQGAIHLLYYSCSDKTVRYATDATGSWAWSVVESAGAMPCSDFRNEEFRTSIAVDNAGRAHLAYQVFGTETSLHYALKDGVDFTVQTVGPGGFFPTIRSDANGSIHLVHATQSGEIHYLAGEQGNFQDTLLTTEISCPLALSMALDSQGRIAAVFMSSTGGRIVIIRKTESGLIQEVANDPEDDGSFGIDLQIGIAIDGNDNANIVFYRYNLYHLSKVDGVWTTEVLPGSGSKGTSPHIAGDAFGGIHIAATSAAGELVYYHRAPLIWSLQNLGGLGRTDFADIAVDSDGHAQMVIYENEQQKIRHIFNQNGRWVGEDAADLHGDFDIREPSLALDGLGHAHICYSDPIVLWFSTFYSTNASGAWVRQLVAPGILGYPTQCSLVVTEDGKPSVLYTGPLTANYSTLVGGAWQSQIFFIDLLTFYLEYGPFSAILDRTDKIQTTFGAWGYYITPEGGFYEISSSFYATGPAFIWSSSEVGAGMESSIAVDSNNKPVILYSGRYLVMQDISGGWSRYYLTPDFIHAEKGKLLLDENDFAHAAVSADETLWYAEFNPNSF